MQLKLTQHFFATDGGSVGGVAASDDGTEYELFADFSIESPEGGTLSIRSVGRLLGVEEAQAVVTGLHQLLQDDRQHALGADETEVLRRILRAAGVAITPRPAMSPDHDMISDDENEAFFSQMNQQEGKPNT